MPEMISPEKNARTQIGENRRTISTAWLREERETNIAIKKRMIMTWGDMRRTKEQMTQTNKPRVHADMGKGVKKDKKTNVHVTMLANTKKHAEKDGCADSSTTTE